MDIIFLFGKRLFIPRGKLVIMYNIRDFCSYVERKIRDTDSSSVDFLLSSKSHFTNACLTLIGISLEKNWALPVSEQREREYAYRNPLEKCFRVSLHSVFNLPYKIVDTVSINKVGAIELHCIDDYLVLIY